MNTKWHFDSIHWEEHSKWWKPYVHSFKLEEERTLGGEIRFKTPEELEEASKANVSYYGHDAFWIFHWLGIEVTFSRY